MAGFSVMTYFYIIKGFSCVVIVVVFGMVLSNLQLPETKYIAKLFRHTDLKIAFKTKNHLTNLISNRIQHTTTPTNSTKFNKSGVYRLKCQTATCGTSDKQEGLSILGTSNTIRTVSTITSHQNTHNT